MHVGANNALSLCHKAGLSSEHLANEFVVLDVAIDGVDLELASWKLM
jgi:hypothetical protein